MRAEVRVSVVQFSPAWFEPAENARRMAEFVAAEARDAGADLVVFPELATMGYVREGGGLEFARKVYAASQPVPGPATSVLADAARKHGVFVVAGLSQAHAATPQMLFNSAVLIGADGEIIGVHHKVHPCLAEKHFYAPGGRVEVFPTDLGAIALNICYDVRFPELSRVQALKGAEIFVSLWASYVQPGKVPSDSIVQRCATRAMENAAFYIGCNRTGTEGENHFYGRSVIAAPSGDLIAVSDGDEEEVIRGTLRYDMLLDQRMYLPIFRDRRPELYGLIAEGLS